MCYLYQKLYYKYSIFYVWSLQTRTLAFTVHLIFDNCHFNFFLSLSLRYFERAIVNKTWNYMNQFELKSKNFELKLSQLKI
jgi:hypothetical protein